MARSDVIFPLAVLGAAGAWFYTRRQEPVATGEGTNAMGFFDGILNAIRGTFSSAPATAAPPPAPQGPLPTNLTLSKDQVYALAAATLREHSFLGTAQDLTITAYIESSFRPWVYREERNRSGQVWDTSWGLMQTLLGTAQDLYNKGYRAKGAPTSDTLKSPEISMYFGAAYKDWLRRSYKGRSDDWYIRAYNGGPGWEGTQNGPANTAIYLSRYKGARTTLYGVA